MIDEKQNTTQTNEGMTDQQDKDTSWLFENNKQKGSVNDNKNSLSLWELKDIIEKSNCDDTDQNIFHKIFEHSIQNNGVPHAACIKRSSYWGMIKFLNEYKLMDQVMMLQAEDGQYLLIYDADIEPQIKSGREIASLCAGFMPRPDAEDLETLAIVDTLNLGNLLIGQNLSPELAEKIVTTSMRTSSFSFAKHVRDDNTAMIYGYMGNKPSEHKRYYKQAIKIIIESAYELTGPMGEMEKERAKHSAKTQEKIDQVIDYIKNDEYNEEDSGYIFSIQHMANGRFIKTDDYIQFGPEEFTSYYNGEATQISADACKDYVNTLKLNIQTGPGQKIFISENQMKEIREQAMKTMNLIKSLPTQNRQEQIKQIRSQIQAICKNIKAATSVQVRFDYLQLLKIYAIAIDTLQFYNNNDDTITIEQVLNHSIGFTLREAEFKLPGSPHDFEQPIYHAYVCNAAIKYYLDTSSEIDMLDSDAPSGSDLSEIIKEAEYIGYIENLEKRIVDKKEWELKPGEMTADQVQSQIDILNAEFNSRKEEALNILNNVHLNMITPKNNNRIIMHETKMVFRHLASYQEDIDKQMTAK